MSDAIRRARKARGWTQEELAARLGLDRRTVLRWERGYFRPTFPTAMALSTLLEVPVEEMFESGRDEDEAADVAGHRVRGVPGCRCTHCVRRERGGSSDMAGLDPQDGTNMYDGDDVVYEGLPERRPSFRLSRLSATHEKPRWSDKERTRLRSRRDEIEREIAALEAADAKYGHDDDYPNGAVVVVVLWFQHSLMGGGLQRYAFLKVSADRWYGTGQRVAKVRMTWAEVREIMESGETQEGPYIVKEYERLPDFLARQAKTPPGSE